MMDINSKAKLNNSIEMPYLGLGLWEARAGKETQNAVMWAIEAGYRHFDTAAIYLNEEDLGIAIRRSDIPREQFFITTKLWNDDQGYDSTLKAFDESLRKLDMDYVDLYLIHWPVKSKRKESWKALEKLYREGRCRAIGVSNYMINHLEEMFEYAEIIPAVNQVEFSPFLYKKELLDYCNSRNIQLEGYSPLTRGKKLDNPVLKKIAKKYNKTTAQVILRWFLEHKIVVIPKSVRKEKIFENADIFDFSFSQEDMKILDSLNENFRVCWNPVNID